MGQPYLIVVSSIHVLVLGPVLLLLVLLHVHLLVVVLVIHPLLVGLLLVVHHVGVGGLLVALHLVGHARHLHGVQVEVVVRAEVSAALSSGTWRRGHSPGSDLAGKRVGHDVTDYFQVRVQLGVI